MKKYNSFFRILFIFIASFVVMGCVHDDKYNDPDLTGYQCLDITPNAENTLITYKKVKELYKITNGEKTYVFPENSTDYIEGYVSSSDETGNIYKTIYIQNALENPTEGFVLSVDAVSTYTRFPQGSKVYIKFKGLAVGTYGELIQLGIKDVKITNPLDKTVARIPEKIIPAHIFKSCSPAGKIVPKVLKISEFAANNDILGALIQVNDVEFTKNVLCTNFAPAGFTVDRQIGEGWNTSNNYTATAVVRNSGFASFANQVVPAANGAFIGIFSKFNNSFQLYINRVGDLDGMKNFPRKDGITSNPCSIDPSLFTAKTVAETKSLLAAGNTTSIAGDFLLKVKVTANDETKNFDRQIYVEDATGGIRINVNKANLYQDARFTVGKTIYIKLKGLAVNNVNGELQLGQINNGQIPDANVYNIFYDANESTSALVPTERTITQLTAADVGRWVKIKNVEFISADLGKKYAQGTTLVRTLQDCNGNKIPLRTNLTASFSGAEVDEGKGDVYAIVTFINGVYHLAIPKQINADLDNPRCDGTVPVIFSSIFADPFETLENWTAVNVSGAQVWGIATFGNPRPSAIMDGNRQANEDWLVSKKISLSGYKDAFVSFESDARFEGNPLELYVTENYTGTPGTTTWTKLNPTLDTDINAFAGFVGSGRVSLKDYVNKEVVIAFKYTSILTKSTTWEIDNFAVKVAR